jgi:enoyl-CoA hydratase / 3-hydroxyacyl-CoA dehydrogenase
VGVGLMGHGIGQVTAQAGYQVVAVESHPKALESGKQRIHSSLKKMLSKVCKGSRAPS